MKKYYVYLLIKDKKPVYIGCSVNLKNRLKSHRLSKDFDSYILLKQYNDKKEALSAENALIRFISIFGGDEWLNSKDFQLVLMGNYKGLNNSVTYID
jgi:hypothetical protein